MLNVATHIHIPAGKVMAGEFGKWVKAADTEIQPLLSVSCPLLGSLPDPSKRLRFNMQTPKT